MSNMKEFHRARILKRLQGEFRKLERLLNGFEKSLETKVKR